MSGRRAAYWVFADQAVVSGCNFLVSALMARFLGVSDFGQWILVFGVVLYANTIAGALVWLPMLTLAPRLEDPLERRHFLQGALAYQMGLTAVIAMVVGLGGAALAWWRPDWVTLSSVVGLAVVVVCFQLQDWVRRYCFANGDAVPALTLDVIAYGGQVALIVALQLSGRLSLSGALMAVAVPYALSFVCGLLVLRLRPDWQNGMSVTRTFWRVGRAYLFGEQTQWFGTAGLLYATAQVLGAQSSGAVRAVQSLLGPTTMLFQASNNLVLPRSAVAYQQSGRRGLSSYLLKVMWMFGVPLFAGLAVLSFLGTQAMTLAFGQAYAAYGGLVAVQALQVGLTFVWLLAMYRARTLDRTDLIMWAGGVQAVVSLVIAFMLAPVAHESGVVLASALGVLAALLVLLKC